MTRCVCCGAASFQAAPVLPADLVEAWELSPAEAAYIDQQQGYHCTACGSNLRSMALARAILRLRGAHEPLEDYLGSDDARTLRVLEINEAGNLTPFLSRLPQHVLVSFPDVDMTDLPFAARSFDVVCHSDTLEHLERPVEALRECRRVLAPSGAVAFTIPMVVGRRTRRRDGLAPSFHLNARGAAEHRVYTEYGADAWLQVIEAGFDECRLVSLLPPAAYAVVGICGASGD